MKPIFHQIVLLRNWQESNLLGVFTTVSLPTRCITVLPQFQNNRELYSTDCRVYQFHHRPHKKLEAWKDLNLHALLSNSFGCIFNRNNLCDMGREGFEPPAFLMSRIYSPLPSNRSAHLPEFVWRIKKVPISRNLVQLFKRFLFAQGHLLPPPR